MKTQQNHWQKQVPWSRHTLRTCRGCRPPGPPRGCPWQRGSSPRCSSEVPAPPPLPPPLSHTHPTMDTINQYARSTSYLLVLRYNVHSFCPLTQLKCLNPPSIGTPSPQYLYRAQISIRFYLISVFPPAPCEAPPLPPLGLVLQLAHHLILNLREDQIRRAEDQSSRFLEESMMKSNFVLRLVLFLKQCLLVFLNWSDLAVHVVHSSISKLLIVGKLEDITISHFDRRSRYKSSVINGCKKSPSGSECYKQANKILGHVDTGYNMLSSRKLP